MIEAVDETGAVLEEAVSPGVGAATTKEFSTGDPRKKTEDLLISTSFKAMNLDSRTLLTAIVSEMTE